MSDLPTAPARYRVLLQPTEPRVWLATWPGDPGRTHDPRHARTYATRNGAGIALGMARRHRRFPHAEIEEAAGLGGHDEQPW